MDKVTSHSWLDEKHNRLSARFAERHQSVLRQFFARDPNLWPLYKIKEIKELVNSKKNLFTPYNLASRHRISSESVIPQQVNPLVRFDPLALYAAATTKNWDDPASVENVISTPCDPAIHGAMLATIANPNLVYSEYAGNATELEKVVVRQMANLVGYDTADATGLFTQGGTFCNLYGYLLGLQNANYMCCLLSQWPNCYVVSGENQGPCVTFRLYNPQLKESARAQFYRERRLIKQKAYMENIVSSATFHRNHFLSRQRRELKTNWITSMARTNYDEQGHCLFLPSEKAVFLNPNTRRSDIEAFVHGLFS
ncbi:pyridoxal-dependent decarboxylase [Vibrio navarrensis]|uniref:pyridoxal-dependent decarboxylase n=1 Tax=Vibrio navarrensis TaxID=29495 RepID=UPI00051DF2EF|nr:pyridoxal-dependent decarboxylase [Vibrio navarrensis]EJK2113213.1 hypothetical protein [Vibrio navarrensis]KGK17751.1 hypothetical protein EA25_12200 [Vibrio navarrensis]MBE4587497.1 hypothetical protein [Vibrio navarrensis]